MPGKTLENNIYPIWPFLGHLEFALCSQLCHPIKRHADSAHSLHGLPGVFLVNYLLSQMESHHPAPPAEPALLCLAGLPDIHTALGMHCHSSAAPHTRSNTKRPWFSLTFPWTTVFLSCVSELHIHMSLCNRRLLQIFLQILISLSTPTPCPWSDYHRSIMGDPEFPTMQL